MSISPGTFGTFPYTIPPLTNVTPFTYRDGATYTEILSKMIEFINDTLLDELDADLTSLSAQFQAGISNAEAAITQNKADNAAAIQTLVDGYNAAVADINNRVGPESIQRVTLTADTALAIDASWPDAHPVWFQVKQDGTGGHNYTLPGTVTGVLDLATTANAVTEFALVPNGDGTWHLYQPYSTKPGEKLDAAVAGLMTRLGTQTKTYLDGLVAPINTSVAANTAAIATKLPQWQPNTAYARDAQVVSPSGDVVTALQAFTSGATYNPANWTGNYGWIFAGHTDNDNSMVQERLQLFYSPDGRTVLGGAGNPLYKPSSTGHSLRDPVIRRAGDVWFMCYTADSGREKTLEVAQSTDLVNWKLTQTIDVSSVPSLQWPWAPELVQDTDGSWVILFTAVETLSGNPHEIYWVRSTNSTLTSWTAPARITWTGLSQGSSPIDPCALYYGGQWHIFYGNNGIIQHATATTLTGVWTTDKAGDWAGWVANAPEGAQHMGYEGPEAVLLPGGVVRLYLDEYDLPSASPIGYCYTESSDGMVTWSVPQRVAKGPSFPSDSQVRHGTWLKLSGQRDLNQLIGAALGTGPKYRHAEFYATGTVPADTTWNGTFTYDTVLSRNGDEIAKLGPGGNQITILRDGVYALYGHFTTSPAANTRGGWLAFKSPDQSIIWCTKDVVDQATADSVAAGNRFIPKDTVIEFFYHPNTAAVNLGEVRAIVTKMQ